MNTEKYITLKIADIRFAINCNNIGMMERLVTDYAGFITDEQPRLKLDLNMKVLSPEACERRYMMATATGNAYENDTLKLDVECSYHEDIIVPVLQVCLRCTMAVNRPSGLLLHSSGVIYQEATYLFSGVSGSGKSTVCKILSEKPGFTPLHDDMLVVTRSEDDVYAWSSPLSGEVPAVSSQGAPLRAMFFLKQDNRNYTIRLNGREAAKRISLSLIPPLLARNGTLENEPMESLKVILQVAESTACYELHFTPDFGFWSNIERLFSSESVMTPVKG